MHGRSTKQRRAARRRREAEGLEWSPVSPSPDRLEAFKKHCQKMALTNVLFYGIPKVYLSQSEPNRGC
jgi:hypothetical protein